MRSSGITVYRDFQQLHSIHSTRRSPRDSSSTNSTFRRQRALRVILHTEGKEIFYPVYKDLQGIPDIPVIHDIPAFQALLHVPAPSSTIQYLPVLSSTFQCYPVYPGIPPVPAFLQIECKFYTLIGLHQKLHRVPVGIFYKHYILQRKGDVAISVKMLTYSTE